MIADVILTTPSGPLSLNTAPYRLAGGSLESSSVTHRRTELQSPFLEGSYVVNSVRENTIVPVSVYVEADTQTELRDAREVLTAALDQVQFTATVVLDEASEMWHCYASDYTVNAPRELLHATKIRVDAQLVRDPKVEVL